MKIFYAIVIVVLLNIVGCNTEPKVSEWYESIKTGKRHKIVHVFEASFEFEQFTKRFEKELSGKKKISKLDYEYLILHQQLLSIYVGEKQHLYYLSDYYEIYGDYFITDAVNEKKLKEDFRKIN